MSTTETHKPGVARTLAADHSRANPKFTSTGAFGCTFVIAPAWSLRLSADDSLVLVPMLKTPGFAMCMQSELQLRRFDSNWVYDVAPTICNYALRVLVEENAGGASSVSEAMSMELLARAFGARLTHTELELQYFPVNSAMTDFCVELDGLSIGVSVTRAMQGSRPQHFSLDDAMILLRKKLAGVHNSTAACYNAGWKKQLLHVWAENTAIEENILAAYNLMPAELTADTVVLVTLCTVPELYHEKRRKPTKDSCSPKVLKGLKDENHLRILHDSEPKCCIPLSGVIKT